MWGHDWTGLRDVDVMECPGRVLRYSLATSAAILAWSIRNQFYIHTPSLYGKVARARGTVSSFFLASRANSNEPGH